MIKSDNKKNLRKTNHYKKKNNNYKKMYRKSIIEAMDFEKTKKYGFDTAYFIFERSINKMEKEGDEAERLALEYLKEKGLLGKEYSENRVIALKNIKIEADIIDYTNKIIYETKSRKTGKLSKQAVIKKWKVFEYDRKGSNYENFEFKGILVANYANGKKVKGILDFKDRKFDDTKVKEDFDKFYKKLEELKKIEKVK